VTRDSKPARDWRTAALGAGAGGAVLITAGVTRAVTSVDTWAGLGQWAGAAGTVAAVAVALGAARREATLQAERVQAEAAEREIQQARLVTAEMVYPHPDEPDYDMTSPAVRITNHSGQPILYPRVEGFVHPLPSGTTTWKIHVYEDYRSAYDQAPILLPPQQHDFVPVDVTYAPPLTEEQRTAIDVPIIGFTDVEGRRWRRNGHGTPVRVSKKDTAGIGGPAWYRAE
jgi:hypothetical protein